MGATPAIGIRAMQCQVTAGPASKVLLYFPLVLSACLPSSTLLPTPTPFSRDHPLVRESVTEFLADPPPGLTNWAALTEISRRLRPVESVEPLSSTGAGPAQALRSFDYVREVLRLSSTDTGKLVGISSNTIRNWRERRTRPYPSSTRNLFSLENTLRALETQLDVPLSEWLRSPLPTGRSPIDLLEQEGEAEFYRASATLLLGRGRALPRPATYDPAEVALADQPTLSHDQRTALFAGKARARRKP